MNNKPFTSPPVAPFRPLSSELVAQVGDVQAFFLENYHRLGPLFCFPMPALNRTVTVLAGPQANLFMAREGHLYLGMQAFRQAQNEAYGVEKTLVSLDGELHTHLRRVQQRGYARSTLDNRYAELVGIGQHTAETWLPGQSLGVTKLMQQLVAEQIGMGVLNASPGAYLKDLLYFLHTVILVTLGQRRPYHLLESADYLQAKERVMRFMDEVIAAHRLPHGRSPDLVDDLLTAVAHEPGLLSPQELRVAVLGPFIAGLDTVANTCAFMLYALLKHPDLLVQVTAETQATFAQGIPTPYTLRQMPLLHQAMMETLRLYPVAPALQGTAVQPFEFAGSTIETGQAVVIATTVSHYLPTFYPDPFRFDIGRFASDRQEHRQPGAFAAFGLGPHSCLGGGMAEILILLTMATLLHTTRFVLDPPDYVLRIQAEPLPGPDEKFRVRVMEFHRKEREERQDSEEKTLRPLRPLRFK